MIVSSVNGPRLECRHLFLVKHMLVEFEEALVTSHETECHRQGGGSYYILMKDCVFFLVCTDKSCRSIDRLYVCIGMCFINHAFLTL